MDQNDHGRNLSLQGMSLPRNAAFDQLLENLIAVNRLFCSIVPIVPAAWQIAVNYAAFASTHTGYKDRLGYIRSLISTMACEELGRLLGLDGEGRYRVHDHRLCDSI